MVIGGCGELLASIEDSSLPKNIITRRILRVIRGNVKLIGVGRLLVFNWDRKLDIVSGL
jgi:hypothetical protein